MNGPNRKKTELFPGVFSNFVCAVWTSKKTTGFLRKAESKINDVVTIPVGKETKVDWIRQDIPLVISAKCQSCGLVVTEHWNSVGEELWGRLWYNIRNILQSEKGDKNTLDEVKLVQSSLVYWKGQLYLLWHHDKTDVVYKDLDYPFVLTNRAHQG